MPRPTMRLTLGALAAAWLAWEAAPARAERLLVLPPSGAGVAAGVLEHGAERLGQQLALAGFETRVVAGPVRPQPATDAEAGQAAQAQQAQAAVLLHIERSGWGTQVRLRVLDAGSGILRHQDSVTLAPTEEPPALELVFEGMAQRLAATGRPEARAGGVATSVPTSAPAPSPPRDPRSLALFFSPRLGGIGPVKNADGSEEGLGVVGLSVGVGTGLWKAELIAETSGDSDEPRGFRSAGVGGLLLPFGQSSFMMYGTTSLRWSFMQLGGAGAAGLVIQPGVGALIPFTDSGRFAFRVELGYFVNLFRERTPDRLVPEPPHLVRGHGIALLLGVLVQP